MKPIKVIATQRGCVYDGPGVRTTVFFKGCTLKCPWCCNPEAISFEDDVFIDNEKCLLQNGRKSDLCARCVRNDGNENIVNCPFGVAKDTSHRVTIEDLLRQICVDESLYSSSGGGVTLSGGEPLCYIQELIPLLQVLQTKSISVYVETSLCVNKDLVVQSKEYIEGVIIDLKLQPEMFLGDMRYRQDISDKVKLLNGKSIIYRLVYVNSMHNRENEVIASLKQIGVKKLELLRCHNLAKAKYQQLGLEYVDFTANEQQYTGFADSLVKSGIDVILLKI